MAVPRDSTNERQHRGQLAAAANALLENIAALVAGILPLKFLSLEASIGGGTVRNTILGAYDSPTQFVTDTGITPDQGDRINNSVWASGTPTFWQWDSASSTWKNGPNFP
jgi:hypothetical protein